MKVDTRFYEKHVSKIKCDALADLTGTQSVGGCPPDVSLTGFAPLDTAGPQDFTFFDGQPPADGTLPIIRAGACFIKADFVDLLPENVVGLVHTEPRYIFSKAAEHFYRMRVIAGPEAIHPSAIIGDNVILAPGVVIGEDAKLGHGTYVGPNSVIGPGVSIGAESQIGPNCSFYCCDIGENLKSLGGVRVGETGFGLAQTEDGFHDTPHYGRVLIGKNCTLGANMTIDRSIFGETIIGDGNKFDNLVHIAHNCVMGKNVRMAAFAGIAGSCNFGDNVTIGGHVGVGDHVNIDDEAVIMSFAGVMHNVPKGAYWGGAPAKPARQHWREIAWISKHTKRKKTTGSA